MTKNTGNRLFYGYICIAAASMVMMLTFGTLYSFGVFFKPLLEQFGWSRAETSGAFSLSFFMQGLMGIPMGKLNDRYGPRLVTALCGVLLGGGFMLMSFVGEMWHLYVLYGIVIAAGVSGSVAMMAIPSRWFVKRRGLMTGLVISGVGLGTVIMPPVANWLIDAIDWRNSYIVIGAVALLMMVGVSFFLRKEPKEMGLTAYGDDGTRVTRSFGSGVDYTFGHAFRTPQFWMLGILFFFHTYCVQTIMAHVALYAREMKLSPEAAAGVISIVGGASIAGRVLMGTLVDKFGSRPILTINFLIKTAALVWLIFAQNELMFVVFAVVFGFGYGGTAVAHTPMVADLFGLSALSLILAGVSLIGTCGAAIGPVVAGGIFDATKSYYWAFIGCVALSLFGTVLAMFLRPVGKQGKKQAAK